MSDIERAALSVADALNLRGEIERANKLLQNIADALGTGEKGQSLVGVARAAHTAEQRSARLEEMLMEVQEFLEGQIDVSDGDYGVPEPNKAMSLNSAIELLLEASVSLNSAIELLLEAE